MSRVAAGLAALDMKKRLRTWTALLMLLAGVLTAAACRAPWRSSNTEAGANNQASPTRWDEGRWNEISWS